MMMGHKASERQNHDRKFAPGQHKLPLNDSAVRAVIQYKTKSFLFAGKEITLHSLAVPVIHKLMQQRMICTCEDLRRCIRSMTRSERFAVGLPDSFKLDDD